jgi:pimeloyl-ACP methyl ester carboxylesterase
MGGIIATKLTQSDINIVGLVYLNSTINYRFVNPFADLINQLMPRVINSRYFPLIARLAFGITTDQKAVDIHQASLLAAQPYAAIGSYRNTILNHDLADILSSLQYPVMVVGGGIDPVLPLNHTFNIIRYARDPKFLFLPFSGHYSMMEYPIRVAAQLLRYIERA